METKHVGPECDNITLWYDTVIISHCDNITLWYRKMLLVKEYYSRVNSFYIVEKSAIFLLKSDQCCEMEVKHVSWSHFWQRFAVNREFQIWGDFAIGWFSTMLSRYFLQLQHTCKTQCIFSDFSTYFLNVFWRKQQECNPGGQNPSFSCSCSFCNDISSLVQCQQRTKI